MNGAGSGAAGVGPLLHELREQKGAKPAPRNGRLGFAPTLRRYRGPLFLAAGGCHHLGTNTWGTALRIRSQLGT